MRIDRKLEKSLARDIIRRGRVSPYAFTAIFVAVQMGMNTVSMFMGSAGLEKEPLFIMGDFTYTVPTLITLPPIVMTFLTLLMNLLLAALMYGYYSYSMTIRAENYAGYDTMFDGFTYVGKVVLLELVMFCFIFLWSLLFAIPGIIAAYRYRFARFNLCENPDIGVMEAIRMSKAQTYGLKWELFVMDWSFFGWDLLSILTLGALNIYVLPYRTQTELGFYEFGKAASGVKPRRDSFDENDGQFHSFGL